ncbi:DUF3784 domain-containing protein [Algoriphagus sp. CAU 1675]|uniref:DUF3784 domain-containing protein n=1 Tax=Algoriphagus sp. CAU 1675 TaxID=3032597 RepID=UPI0023DA19F0|nr:DUF3784 domain-containing protein [Algoriphagus sp. CAU 1675]MDF2157555.1 DUF3784 domain-containing protein [Algoriphagus sp. CAU 1675]
MGILVTGLSFVAIGILIKMFPGLLAGYNSLSQKEKENAINNGLPNFAFITFISMGLIVVIGHFVSIWLEKPLGGSIVGFVSIAGVITMIVAGNLLINKRPR